MAEILLLYITYEGLKLIFCYSISSFYSSSPKVPQNLRIPKLKIHLH